MMRHKSSLIKVYILFNNTQVKHVKDKQISKVCGHTLCRKCTVHTVTMTQCYDVSAGLQIEWLFTSVSWQLCESVVLFL